MTPQITADRLFSLLPKRTYAPVVETIQLNRRAVSPARKAASPLAFAFCVAVLDRIFIRYRFARPSDNRASPEDPPPQPVEGVQ